jgi:hypothetical protein
MSKKYIKILLFFVCIASSSVSQAITLQLSVFENSAGLFSGSVDVYHIDEDTVITTFNNTSLINGPVIKSLHFESGVADWLSNPVWSNLDMPGNNENDIVFEHAKKPSGAPGGQNIGWAVSHVSGATSYELQAKAPGPFNGLNGGESLQISWDLSGEFSSFIDDVKYGDSRFALHVLDCEGSNSCSAVSAVPVPAALWLFSSGLLGLIGFSRWKRVN